jgi:hypothetical protein
MLGCHFLTISLPALEQILTISLPALEQIQNGCTQFPPLCDAVILTLSEVEWGRIPVF